MVGFVVALGPVNELADRTPGFVWRLPSEESHGATTVEDGGFPLVLNLSVWESYEALRRLRHLRTHGPTPQAFTPRRRFDPQGRALTRR
jgi:hypothetical protein